jgi:hypothetical protein
MKYAWKINLALIYCTYTAAMNLCKQAQELGPYGSSPWGADSAFADPTAQWLATTNGSVQFAFRFRNIHQEPIAGKLHVLGNADIIITVNGKAHANFTGSWGSNDYMKYPVRFLQVKNSIRYELFAEYLNLLTITKILYLTGNKLNQSNCDSRAQGHPWLSHLCNL